jgi:phosphate transport system substrate-binding protein
LLNKTLLAATVAVAALSAGAAEARTEIRVVGSSTVYPFTTAVAEQFTRANPQFRPPVVESTGTGGGIKLFCAGVGAQHPDIANASRRMKASEAKQCAENGVTNIVEVQIGNDGLVLARAKNGATMALTPREVYAALAATPWGKPNKAKTWKDVNAKLPATKIEVIGPPPTSGTRDAFNDLYMDAGCNTNPSMAALKKSNEAQHKSVCTKIREDGAYIEAGENDNLIVQKLAGNPNAVGIFGYSFLEENADKLKGLTVNGVSPTYESIASYKYPGSRPLFIYVKGQHLRAVRGLKEFLAEYSKESTWGKSGYLVRRGLVAAPDDVRQKNARIAAGLTPLNVALLK